MEHKRGQRHDGKGFDDPSAGSAPRIILTGRPGAGKGTQGQHLASRLGVQYLSTGDLLRTAIAGRSALGRAVESLVQTGELIPTALIITIVKVCLHGDGYVLDGFPRTVEQAVAVNSALGLEPHVAIEIVVPAATAFARLTLRGRADDDVNIALKRLAIYETETVPMHSYLTGHGLLRRVNGDDHPDIVARNIWRETSPLAHLSARQGSGESGARYVRTDAAARFAIATP